MAGSSQSKYNAPLNFLFTYSQNTKKLFDLKITQSIRIYIFTHIILTNYAICQYAKKKLVHKTSFLEGTIKEEMLSNSNPMLAKTLKKNIIAS